MFYSAFGGSLEQQGGLAESGTAEGNSYSGRLGVPANPEQTNHQRQMNRIIFGPALAPNAFAPSTAPANIWRGQPYPDPGWRPALFARADRAGPDLQTPISLGESAYFGDGTIQNVPLSFSGGPTLTLGNFKQTLFRLHQIHAPTGASPGGVMGSAHLASIRAVDSGAPWGSGPDPKQLAGRLLFNGGIRPECGSIVLQNMAS